MPRMTREETLLRILWGLRGKWVTSNDIFSVLTDRYKRSGFSSVSSVANYIRRFKFLKRQGYLKRSYANEYFIDFSIIPPKFKQLGRNIYKPSSNK